MTRYTREFPGPDWKKQQVSVDLRVSRDSNIQVVHRTMGQLQNKDIGKREKQPHYSFKRVEPPKKMDPTIEEIAREMYRLDRLQLFQHELYIAVGQNYPPNL